MRRESGVFCGSFYAEESFRRVDGRVRVTWLARDGDRVLGGQELLRLEGPARAMLTGERTALNFMQTLSGTATAAAEHALAVAHTGVRLLDTRKTLPGLRLAQKWAVRCGGCANHRLGLHDAFLLKENHLAAFSGDVGAAVRRAREIAPGKKVEVEVRTDIGSHLQQSRVSTYI